MAECSRTAAVFNGTSSYVSLPGGLISDSTDVSVGLWFKAASTSKGGVLFGYQSAALSAGTSAHYVPALYIGANGELYGEFWNGAAAPIHTSFSVKDGNWHYAVLSGDSSSQALYLDGTPVGTLSGQINQLNQKVTTVGAGYWHGGWPENTQGGTATVIGYFDGNIGQVAVYPQPLSAATVKSQYALAGAASPVLTKVTLPSGNIDAQASYDAGTARLTSYTDSNGGEWTVGQPLATGIKTGSDAISAVVDNVAVTGPDGRHQTYGYDITDGGRLVSY
ncbi:MAG TPA: LamG domain-containing protein, partial [Trebonia sp.]